MAKNPITVLEEGNKLLNELSQKLIGVNTNLLEISKTARSSNLKDYFNIKSPSDVNEKLKLQKTIIEQLNAEVRERDRLERALSNQLAKNKLAESELAKELAKSKFEQQQLNKANREAAVLSSRLATEYQKLVVRMNQAGRAKQNLVAKQAQGIQLSNKEQVELKQSTLEFAKYQKAVLKADASIGRFQRNVGNYSGALGKAGAAFRNFVGVFGVFSASLIAKDIFDTIKELDGLNKALKQVTETQEAFNAAQLFIKALAEEAGVEIKGLQQAYVKFFASAKTTNLTLAETQNIFRQVAKAGAVLGLSTDDINGSFRALEQILSKGKVQAEEIRGQLGERLPGAFQILAKSMGLTTAELSKQLELGNVISDEVLPGFARELEKTYSLENVQRVETLTSAQNRLSNAWTEFVASLDGSEGTLTRIFSFVLDGLGAILDALKDINLGAQGREGELLASLTSQAQLREVANLEENVKLLGTTLEEEAKMSIKNSESKISKLKEEISVLETRNKAIRDGQKGLGEKTGNASELSKNRKELENLNRTLANYQGALAGAKSLIEETAKETDYETKVLIRKILAKSDEYTAEQLSIKSKEDLIKILDKLNDKRKKGIDAIEGSIEWLKKQVSALEDEQQKLATNSKEWNAYKEKIDEAKKAVKDFEIAIKGVLELKSLGNAEDALERITKILTTPKTIEGLDYDKLNAELEGFSKNFEDSEKEKYEIAKKYAEMREDLERGLVDSALEFTNTIFDAKIQAYDDEIQKNNDYYAALLDNQNLSEEQRSAIEAERERKNAELEKKKREEQRKAAIFNKIASLATIAIQTATAAAGALAPPPVGLGPVLGETLLPFIIANGALQAATVLATPLPAYEKGKGEYDKYEGLAIWGEKKREAKISKDGTIELSPTKIGNHLTHVKSDDIIHPDASKFLSSLSDEELYNNIHKYTILSNISNQSEKLETYLLTQSINNQTTKMIKAIEKNKPKVNVYNNISTNVTEDIAFIIRKQNTL